jgi:hypothetical protein
MSSFIQTNNVLTWPKKTKERHTHTKLVFIFTIETTTSKEYQFVRVAFKRPSSSSKMLFYFRQSRRRRMMGF